ncbi:MAG: M15 family peptidase, partial [Prevotella sp.]|nr:M15 family peptidase [Prevotella sp.]
MAYQQDSPWQAGKVLSEQAVQTMGLSNCFTAKPIPDDVFARMQGKSWKDGCPLKRSDYRYLKILHRNAEGKSQMGEMICNKGIAKKLLKIFRQLYDADYRIERMVLIDHYDADDERSMMANNTTCFNYRVVKGSSKLSAHA